MSIGKYIGCLRLVAADFIAQWNDIEHMSNQSDSLVDFLWGSSSTFNNLNPMFHVQPTLFVHLSIHSNIWAACSFIVTDPFRYHESRVYDMLFNCIKITCANILCSTLNSESNFIFTFSWWRLYKRPLNIGHVLKLIFFHFISHGIFIYTNLQQQCRHQF